MEMKKDGLQVAEFLEVGYPGTGRLVGALPPLNGDEKGWVAGGRVPGSWLPGNREIGGGSAPTKWR
jgi:hypothetical protein